MINIEGHTFLDGYLDSSSKVIDFGTNIGNFSSRVSSLFRCSIVGLEADPKFFHQIPFIDGVEVQNLAIAASPGYIDISTGDDFCSSVRFSDAGTKKIQVEAITMQQFFENHNLGIVDLVKIDIEGAELDILSQDTLHLLKKTKQISIEFHDFLCKQDVPIIKEKIKFMNDNGFSVINFSFFTYGDVLFINNELLPITHFEYSRIIFIKYWRGIKRFFTKKISSSVSLV